MVRWLEAHPEALSLLLRGYAQPAEPAVALHYGAMLRVCRQRVHTTSPLYRQTAISFLCACILTF